MNEKQKERFDALKIEELEASVATEKSRKDEIDSRIEMRTLSDEREAQFLNAVTAILSATGPKVDKLFDLALQEYENQVRNDNEDRALRRDLLKTAMKLAELSDSSEGLDKARFLAETASALR